jgi:hypothetical protein
MSLSLELSCRSVLPEMVTLIDPGRNQTAGKSISKVRISELLVILKVVQDVIMNADMVQAGPQKDIPMRVAPGL